MEPEQMNVRLVLKSTREVEQALSKIEELFADEGGWWKVPAGRVDLIEVDLVVDEVAYFGLTQDEFVEALGFDANWVLECYEV